MALSDFYEKVNTAFKQAKKNPDGTINLPGFTQYNPNTAWFISKNPSDRILSQYFGKDEGVFQYSGNNAESFNFVSIDNRKNVIFHTKYPAYNFIANEAMRDNNLAAYFNVQSGRGAFNLKNKQIGLEGSILVTGNFHQQASRAAKRMWDMPEKERNQKLLEFYEDGNKLIGVKERDVFIKNLTKKFELTLKKVTGRENDEKAILKKNNASTNELQDMFKEKNFTALTGGIVTGINDARSSAEDLYHYKMKNREEDAANVIGKKR